MSNLLLTTKLHVPQVRPGIVQRPHLVMRLEQGLAKKLILVSAPAGYGKTTLICEWLGACGQLIAWVSLDKGDNDPARFWANFLAACHSASSSVGKRLPDTLLHPNPPNSEALITDIINEMDGLQQPIVLVLDDYHSIENQVIHDGLSFLLEHAPVYFHLVLATRADPPLPLARLRGLSQMVELRLADLRFTKQEISEFLRRVMSLDISQTDLSLLEASTEGWIAGLQMAGLSLQGKEDVSAFIRSFGGENRYILDFLFEEVFQRQPKEIQRFLLESSILDRLCASLCNAVTERENSQAILGTLERSNLFLISLDDQRKWYRYHHLFSDLLRPMLEQVHPGLSGELHRRACRWYEAQGMLPEALDHALAAGDMELAAHTISNNVLALVENDEAVFTLQKIDSVPADKMIALPWLGIARAWALGARQVHKSHQLLDAVEKSVDDAPDSIERQRLKGHIAAARAFLFSIQGDRSNTIAYARQANKLLPPDEIAVRALNLAIWGDVRSDDRRHDPRTMHMLEQALALALQAEKPHVAMIAAAALASANLHVGRLRELHRVCLEALDIAEDYQSRYQRPLSATASVYSLLARVLSEWGENEKAVQFATRGLRLSERWGQADTEVLCLNYLGRALVFGNDSEQARQVFRRAQTAAQKISPWFWEMTITFTLDSLLDCETPDPGEIAQQMRRVQESGARFTDLLTARLKLRDNQPGEALVALERTLSHLNGQPSFDTVRIYGLRALAFQAQGDEKQALTSLRQALELAEPENRVATFVREGVAMEKLLRLALSKSIAPAFVQQLLTAFDSRRKPKPEPALVAQMLVEPLSRREMDVMRLLAQGCSDKKMAETLVVSRETIHKHLKNIYGKLGVHSRAEAVVHARELGLL